MDLKFNFQFFSNPTAAQFHPKSIGQSIDAKVKQAVINSKQQAFKNLNVFNAKNEVKTVASQDQIARPAQVQNDISVDSPKDHFLPSPELSPLYNRENELPDHFHPMNNYHRPPKQETRFPTESSNTPFSSNPMLGTRWSSGNQPPHNQPPLNEVTRPTIDFMRPPQFHQGRNTNVNFPFYQPRHRPFHQEENFKFPSQEISNSDEYLRSANWPNQVHGPEIHYKKTKGTWKWIPDEDSTERNYSDFQSSEPESTLPHHEPQLHYETSRPQTSHDRPYSFDSPEDKPSYSSYHNHNQPTPTQLSERFPTGPAFLPEGSSRFPTGPGAWPSSGTDTLLATEEYSTLKHDGPVKVGHDGKQLR